MAIKPQTIKPVLMEPVASPVDTFVRAAKPDESPLWQVANSLKGLERNLDGYIAQKSQEAQDADALAGEAAFYKNNQAGYDQGVKEGLIPAFASPNFVKAYKKAEGNVLGMQLATKFKTAYDDWEGKNSSDPNAFTGFFQKFVSENIPQSSDPSVLQGVMPHLRNLVQGGQSAFDQDRHKNMYSGSRKAHGAMGKQAVDQATIAGIGSPKGFDADGLYTTLMGIRTESLKTLRTEDVDKDFVDNITSAAMERAKVNHQDARKLLLLLDKTVPGQTYKWSDTQYAREQKQATLGQLDTIWKQGQTEATAKQKEADRKQLNEAQSGVIQFIIQNPGKAIPDELLAKGSAVHGTFKVDAMGWAKTITGDRVAEDPEAVRQLFADIIAGGGQASVRAALGAGTIRSSDTLKQAYDFAEKVSGPNSPVARAKDSAGYKAARTLLQTQLASDKLSNPWGPPRLSVDASRALTDFEIAHDRYIIENPDVATDPMKLADYQQKLAETILKGATVDIPVGDSYSRTPEVNRLMGGQQPTPQAAPPTPTPQAAPQAPSRPDGSAPPTPGQIAPPSAPAAPAQPSFTPEQRQSYLGTRSPEQRQLIEQSARQRGVPVDSVVDGLLRRSGPQALPSPDKRSDAGGAPVQQARLGFDPSIVSSFLERAGVEVPQALKSLLSPNAANAATTDQPRPNPFGDAIRSAFKSNPALAKTGDPATERLLTFIGGLEAPRGYDQLYGGNAPSERPITSMTLNEVLALQQSQRRSGAKSTAAGRYQFIYKTLSGLKKAEGLSGEEVFTPQLQDRLASVLLENRGYSDWKAGKISTEQFADNLAAEWASLPMADGRSRYAGDGLNKALTTRSRVRKVLGD